MEPFKVCNILKPKTKEEIIKNLSELSHNELNDIFIKYSELHNECVVMLLIDLGVDINYTGQSSITSLHYMTNYNKINACKKLINAGANINTQENSGWTALHYAALENNIDIVKLLLNNNANKNIQNNSGKIPLHLTTNPYIIDLLNNNESK